MNAKYILSILVMLLLMLSSTAAALPTNTHGTVHGEMYVASTANWPSSSTTNTFDVPNGTVVYARYYVGVWASSTPSSISTTFNGHAFPTNPAYYSSDMGVTWIPYDITDHVIPGEVNTATINSGSWGDGRQYGSTIVVVLENEGRPQIEYWVAEGLDWMHYGDGDAGPEVASSTTYFNGTVDLTDVESASLYSTHLTGYNYEALNGNSLSSASESVSGDYFNYLRWDNVEGSLVPGNQTVLVSRGGDDFCSSVFHALAIESTAPDLVSVDLTPYFVSVNTTNTMTATIENQGSKDAGSFNVSLMVDGTVVDTQAVSGLATGGSTTVDLYWMPEQTGTYSLTVTADPDNAILESDETNNVLIKTAGAKERPGDSVSMTTNILPAVSFVVTPGTLNFGKLAAGETSDTQVLNLENTGGFNIHVSADVTDTADDLFVNGLQLDSAAWSEYGNSIAAAGSDTAGSALEVPGNYVGVGAQVGTLMFWAEAE